MKKISEYFGDLRLGPVTGPPLSYGHIICLGAPVTYPENTEPNVKPVLSSIDEGIELLETKKDIDYSQHPLAIHYREMCNYLKEQFPDYNVQFSGMGYEGPITSAILLRGQDFIYDVLDEPEKAKKFLALLTDSVVNFCYFVNRENGVPEVNPRGAGLCDDFSSLISPDMWPEFVIPYWTRYFESITTETGRRFLHCENLAPAHLKYFKDARISHFQPSVSPMLTIENVKANTDVPFDWLLYAFRITGMSDDEIEEWVDNTVKEGITRIRTQFGQYACDWQADRMCFQGFDKYRVE